MLLCVKLLISSERRCQCGDFELLGTAMAGLGMQTICSIVQCLPAEMSVQTPAERLGT